MRRTLYFVMALALVLGFTQCKKEQPTPQTQGVRITLNVNGGNSNSRVNVNPNAPEGYATVTFEDGDVIYVGNNGHYCGYLEYDGTNYSFSGTIDDMGRSTDDYLHFYFMGNKGEKSEPSTVSITDQTAKYPVISYAHSNEFYGTTDSYSAKLQNYCAIVKFTTNDIPTATAVTVKGMQNTVSVDFGKNNAAESKLDINPYTPGQSGDGDIILHAESSTERWAILLEQAEVGNATVTADDYFDGTCNVPEIANNTYHPTGVSVELVSKTIDLSKVTEHITIQDGCTVTGILGANVKISKDNNATVTLDGVTINGVHNLNYSWAGINCLGDATIILKDGSTNTVKGFYEDYPGIQPAVGYTLIIKGGAEGTGKLNASSNGQGAGIGGGNGKSCGNIEIQGGTVTATGSGSAAGIGSGGAASCGAITISGGTVTATTNGIGAAGIGSGYTGASCGAITISGGTVTATGGMAAAGIGSGYQTSCGDITITTGVTKVTATMGNVAIYSIGAGRYGSCGKVTIGGTVYPDGATPNQANGLTFVYPVTITWNSSQIGTIEFYGEGSKTIDGITMTLFGDDSDNSFYNNSMYIQSASDYTGLRFSSDDEEIKITKIEIVHSGTGYYYDFAGNGGWPNEYAAYEGGTFTWSGTPSTTVTLRREVTIEDITSIVFTIE